MSSKNNEVFTKDNLDRYLNELSKEYKKLGGRNVPVEIVLIGGAAVIEKYGFRDMTTDIDAIIPAASIMKDAIYRVGVNNGIPEDWINADFIMTDSYSSHLNEHSLFYRTFNQVLHVRIVTGEYLIAMKLRAGRKYKNDLSDIVGILSEHEKNGTPISYEMIDHAVNTLYGGWKRFPEHSIKFIHSILDTRDYEGIYKKIREGEQEAHNVLLKFETKYPGLIKEEMIDSILEKEVAHKSRQSVLDQLNDLKQHQKKNSTVPLIRSGKEKKQKKDVPNF